MSEHVQEQRSELRLDARAAVFVELPHEEGEEDGIGDLEPRRLLLCRLLDFSTNGLRIRIDRALPVGAILRLCAQLPDAQRPMQVVGEVRWVREEGKYFLVGFSLFEAEQTDILAWKRLLVEQL